MFTKVKQVLIKMLEEYLERKKISLKMVEKIDFKAQRIQLLRVKENRDQKREACLVKNL